jgi:hypothetical protein
MLFDQKSIKAVIFTILFLNQYLLLDYTLFLIALFSIMLYIIDTTYLVDRGTFFCMNRANSILK